MRADPMMARSTTLQAEAGYIDARPYLPDRRNLLQRAAGPYIWVIFDRAVELDPRVDVRFASESDQVCAPRTTYEQAGSRPALERYKLIAGGSRGDRPTWAQARHKR